MNIDRSTITNDSVKMKEEERHIYMWDISIHIELRIHQ